MKKKMKYWLGFIGTKNLIAISALVIFVAAIAIGVAVSNNKKGKEADTEIEESTGLQVEENADDVEGDSIDFSEFLSEDEKEQEGNKGGSNNSGNGNSEGNNGLTVEGGSNSNGGSGSQGGNEGSSGNEGAGGNEGTGSDKYNNTGSEFGQLF